MEDINITGADFGSNLPKWATDETLRRLKRVIENDSVRDKKEIRDKIGISADSFNNNMSMLRKYKILDKDNRLNKFF